MRAWRITRARWAEDLSGQGAAQAGGRWNDQDVPALYMGLTPAICCLEVFVHASGMPQMPMKISCFELPADPDLYLQPDPASLPEGWAALPCDRPSIDYGTAWLRRGEELGLILPSAVLPLEHNILLNPAHPACRDVRMLDSFDFNFDPRMFNAR